jgi:ankyrin repeat protein
LLLESGADPHLKNIVGQTSLHLAAKGGHFKTLKILIEMNMKDKNAAVIDAKDSVGWTALSYAVKSGKPDTVKYLLENSANPGLTDNDESTCLHYASCINLRCVKMLVDHYPVDYQNHRQETPLHWAASIGHYSIVSFFLERNADPNLKNIDGQSSLHVAAKKGHFNTVNMLVGKSADLYAEDKNGHIPVALAEQLEEKKVAEYLRDQMQGPGSSDGVTLVPSSAASHVSKEVSLVDDLAFKHLQALLPNCDFQSPVLQQEKQSAADAWRKLV